MSGKKVGHPARMQKIKLQKVKRNEPKTTKFHPEKWAIEK